jgi:hypothetical protein
MFSTRMFSTTFDNIDVESLQAEVDWRRSGAMSSIDYQGHCGMVKLMICHLNYLFMYLFNIRFSCVRIVLGA